MAFSGSKNSRWRGGVSQHTHGYWRLNFVPFRGLFLHRWWFEQMLKRKLRKDEEVEHTCFNPTCLNTTHWILMSAALHHSTSATNSNYKRNHYSLNLFEQGKVSKRRVQSQKKAAAFIQHILKLIEEKIAA